MLWYTGWGNGIVMRRHDCHRNHVFSYQGSPSWKRLYPAKVWIIHLLCMAFRQNDKVHILIEATPQVRLPIGMHGSLSRTFPWVLLLVANKYRCLRPAFYCNCSQKRHGPMNGWTGLSHGSRAYGSRSGHSRQTRVGHSQSFNRCTSHCLVGLKKNVTARKQGLIAWCQYNVNWVGCPDWCLRHDRRPTPYSAELWQHELPLIKEATEYLCTHSLISKHYLTPPEFVRGFIHSLWVILLNLGHFTHPPGFILEYGGKPLWDTWIILLHLRFCYM